MLRTSSIEIRALSNAVAHELPDALRPSWAAETWSGRHGANALEAVVDRTDSAVKVERTHLTGETKTRGILRDDVHSYGTFERQVLLESSGRLSVEHALLKVAPNQQRLGFAQGFNDRAFARYAAAGVDEVRVHAALTMGGYAWARAGFELVVKPRTAGPMAEQIARGRAITELVDAAAHQRRITSAEARTLVPRLVTGDSLPAHALTSIADLAAVPDLGRRILAGAGWHGARPIEHTNPWWASGGTQARSGVGEVARAASADAAQRVAATLPAAVDPVRAAAALSDALAASRALGEPTGDVRSSTWVRLGDGDRVKRVSMQLNARTEQHGWVGLTTTLDGKGRLTAQHQLGDRSDSATVQPVLDSVTGELGVEQVRSGPFGLRRRVVAAG